MLLLESVKEGSLSCKEVLSVITQVLGNCRVVKKRETLVDRRRGCWGAQWVLSEQSKSLVVGTLVE